MAADPRIRDSEALDLRRTYTIQVGDGTADLPRTMFHVYADCLPAESDMFDDDNRILNPRGQIDFRIPDHDPESFECYIYWRMFRKIRVPDTQNAGYIYDRLCHAYMLAKEVPDTEFANAIIESLVATALQSRRYPDLDVVTDVYTRTSHVPDARGRDLIVVLYFCRARNPQELNDITAQLPGEFQDDFQAAYDRLPPPDGRTIIDRVRVEDFYDEE